MPISRDIRMPEDSVAVRLGPADHGALSIAAVLRREPDPVAGRLVALPAPVGGDAFLGVLLDADDRPIRWLRVERQDLRPEVAWEPDNHERDRRWAEDARALASVGGPDVLRTGWETAHPRPTTLDPGTWTLHPVLDPDSGEPLRLCTDDAALRAAGRPPYGGGLHRHLAAGDPSRAAAVHEVTPGAMGAADAAIAIPGTPSEVPAAGGATGSDSSDPSGASGASAPRGPSPAVDAAPLVPAGHEAFDLACGLRRVTVLDDLDLDAAIDLLAGREATGVRHGRAAVPLDRGHERPVADEPTPIVGDGWLFHGSFGRRARIVESLHLRLRLWTDVVEDAAALVAALGRPLLDIRPERIGIRLADAGPGLPRLWTLRARLLTPGRTAERRIPGTDDRRFVRIGEPTPSVYEPGSASGAPTGRGRLRVREVLDEDGRAVVTGTIEAAERLPSGRRDLVRLDLPLRDRLVALHVRIEPPEETGDDPAGPRRWRSLPTTLDAEARAAVEAAAGIALDDVRYAGVAAVGTPADLHALAVLGVRMLLCDRASELPAAVDDLLAFAARLAGTHDGDAGEGGTPLEERIDFLLRADARWAERLGPHRLRPDEPASVELVPAPMWHAVLAALVRMVPGGGPDAWCRDLGDMPAAAPERVLDPAREALATLVLRSRSLAVVDWRQNREVAGLLRRVRGRLSAGGPT